jgi:hypothetical protein
VARPGVVRIRMGNERSGGRADRIDVEVAQWAIKPGLPSCRTQIATAPLPTG